jgi:hypothetical protein
MSNEIQDNALPNFKAAIEACLSFQYFKEDTQIDNLIYHRNKLYNDMGLRRKIYAEIVAPLERELCISFPKVKLDKLRDMPLSFTFWERIDLVPHALTKTRKVIQIPQKTGNTNPPLQETRLIKSILTKFSPYANAQTQHIQPIFFHNVPLSLSNDRQVTLKWQKIYSSILTTIYVVVRPLRNGSRTTQPLLMVS